jgi:16S rRNA (uracil1498-N3)-methyltransferase
MSPDARVPMPDRYFSETPIVGDDAVLAGPEAHHLIHVMRARAGDRVVLFDGSGWEWEAEVAAVGRHEVRLRLLAQTAAGRELPLEVTLGVALPKGDRQKWLVEKAVELGATRLVPLRTARSVAQPGPKAVHRLRRTVIEASKQCGRNRLMEIAPPQAWEEFIVGAPHGVSRLLAHPKTRAGPKTPTSALEHLAGDALREPVLLAVGPEGGSAPAEVDQAMVAGWEPVDLGPRTLRVETAAVLLLAIVAARAATTQAE